MNSVENAEPRTVPISTSVAKERQVAEDDSSGYAAGGPRPVWRGKIHRIAFYGALVIYAALMITTSINKIYLTIYFASQAMLYGVSSTYHLTEWRSREAERLFRKLDHSSIFLLISGTQTCVFMAMREVRGPHAFSVGASVVFSYIVAVVGILKVVFLPRLPRFINVAYYIGHGTSAVAFVPLDLLIKERAIAWLCLLGGISYILGGVVYGARVPDPWPKVFGYHEVFHVLTVAGNSSFLLTIIWAHFRRKVIGTGV